MDEDKGIFLIIKPPEGFTFGECSLCQKPFLYDGTSENCLWCEIHKDDNTTG